MKKIILLLTFCLSFTVNADTASEVKQAVLENLQQTQNENLAGAMATMHSKSPAYGPTQEMLKQIFTTYDIKYKILEYHFVGSEADYAYVRIIQRTEKINGPAFTNNDLEALLIFKQEQGQWKLWTQANLGIIYL